MRLMSFILLVVILAVIVGCSGPQVTSHNRAVDAVVNTSNNTVENATIPSFKPVPEETPENVKESARFFVGGEGTLLGHNIQLLEVSPGGSSVLEIDKMRWEVYSTKTREIVNGLDFSVVELQYDINNPSNRSVVIEASNLELGPHEYFLKWDEEKTIEGVSVKITNIRKSPRSVRFDIGNERKSVVSVLEGESESVDGLKISVVDAFARDLQYEGYAIVRFELE